MSLFLSYLMQSVRLVFSYLNTIILVENISIFGFYFFLTVFTILICFIVRGRVR